MNREHRFIKQTRLTSLHILILVACGSLIREGTAIDYNTIEQVEEADNRKKRRRIVSITPAKKEDEQAGLYVLLWQPQQQVSGKAKGREAFGFLGSILTLP